MTVTDDQETGGTTMADHTTPTPRRRGRAWRAAIGVAVTVGLLGGVLTACGSDDSSKSESGTLTGLFRLDAGKADGDDITGSWFKMVQPGGTVDKGPYMPNGDSPVQGGSVTLLSPGTEGGLRTGAFQSEPAPAFDNGNSLSGSIMAPTKFFGVGFGTSTNAIDPQTRNPAAAPSVLNEDGKLTANLTAWAASWNNQEFNQGAPKIAAKAGPKVPGAEQAEKAWDYVSQKWLGQSAAAPGQGPSATGTYDSSNKSYTLEWTSLIVGGPFNGFTGVWHLAGTFEPSAAAPSNAPPPA